MGSGKITVGGVLFFVGMTAASLMVLSFVDGLTGGTLRNVGAR